MVGSLNLMFWGETLKVKSYFTEKTIWPNGCPHGDSETSISEIGSVFIRKELGPRGHKWETNLPFSSAFVQPPLTASLLHKKAGSNFAGNVFLCKTLFVHRPDLSCFAKSDLFSGCVVRKNWRKSSHVYFLQLVGLEPLSKSLYLLFAIPEKDKHSILAFANIDEKNKVVARKETISRDSLAPIEEVGDHGWAARDNARWGKSARALIYRPLTVTSPQFRTQSIRSHRKI